MQEQSQAAQTELVGHSCIMWSTAGSISSSIDDGSGGSECCGDILIIVFVPSVPL